jgi:hypothetical protein
MDESCGATRATQNDKEAHRCDLDLSHKCDSHWQSAWPNAPRGAVAKRVFDETNSRDLRFYGQVSSEGAVMWKKATFGDRVDGGRAVRGARDEINGLCGTTALIQLPSKIVFQMSDMHRAFSAELDLRRAEH